MAAPKENSLSLGFGIGMERNIFTKERQRSQNNRYNFYVLKPQCSFLIDNLQLDLCVPVV